MFPSERPISATGESISRGQGRSRFSSLNGERHERRLSCGPIPANRWDCKETDRSLNDSVKVVEVTLAIHPRL